MVINGEPILLPGFDGAKQLEHNFKTNTFDCVWLQRLYTDENSPVLKHSSRRRVQEIKFGNNITVLLRACFHLRDFYGLSSFWPAVARGFKTSPANLAVETASCFVAARRIFNLNGSDSPKFSSPATRAADAWISYLDSRPVQPLSRAPAADVARSAATFFSGMANSPLVDSALIAFEDDRPAPQSHITAHSASSAGSRKRSPSLNLPDQPPVTKRRSVAGALDKSTSTSHPQDRVPQSLPPLATGPNIATYPKQDPYQTPSTAQDRQTSDGYFAQATSDDQAGIRIRGQAHAQLQSPSSEEPSSSYGELRQAHIRLQVRVELLERDKKQSEEIFRAMNAKFMELEKKMRVFEAQPARVDQKAIEETKGKVVSLETQAQTTQEKLANDSKTFRSLEEKIRSMEKELKSKAQRPESTEAYQAMQKLVQLLESSKDFMKSVAFKRDENLDKSHPELQAVLVDKVRDALHENQEVTPRAEQTFTVKAQPPPGQHMEEMASRLKAVEAEITEGHETSQTIQTRVAALEARTDTEGKCTFTELRNQVMATDRKLTAEATVIRELENQIPSLMRQQQQISNTAIDNASQMTLLKQLDQQVTFLRNDMNSSRGQHGLGNRMRELDDKILTLQGNMTAVRKTIKDLANKNSAPPPTNDLLKKVESLRKSVTEELAQSVAQMGQTLQDTVEKCRRQTLREVEDRLEDIEAAADYDKTVRVDEVAEAVEVLKTTMQPMPHKIKALEDRVKIMATKPDIVKQETTQNTDPASLTGRIDEILQRVQEVEQVQQAQPSVDTPDALRKLEQLSQTVGNLLEGNEQRLDVPNNIDVLFQRVEKVETALRGLTTALMGRSR